MTKELRGNILVELCPSRQILRHMTSRWGTLVLIALQNDTLRFSELRRRIGGVSERMLAQTLDNLVADGLILRTDRQQVPPHVDYRLTETGREAAARLRNLTDWIEENLDRFSA